jgi:hypothetical protein
LTAFREWLFELDSRLRGRQIESDAAGGKLGRVAERAFVITKPGVLRNCEALPRPIFRHAIAPACRNAVTGRLIVRAAEGQSQARFIAFEEGRRLLVWIGGHAEYDKILS